MANDAALQGNEPAADMPQSKPAWWTRRRIIALFFGLPLLLFVGCYLVMLARYHSLSPQINRNYSAEFNEPILKIPPEQRAWTHYRRALMLLEKLPDETLFEYTIGEGPPRFEPRDPDWNAKLAYLRRNQEGLAAVRAAAKIRPLGVLISNAIDPEDQDWLTRHGETEFPERQLSPSENPELSSVPFRNGGQLVELQRLLQADTWRAIEIRDGARIVDNLDTMLLMSEQLGDSPLFIAQVISDLLIQRTTELASRVLADHAELLSAADLQRLAAAIDGGMKVRAQGIRFDGERAMFEDMIQRTYSDDGDGDGILLFDYANEFFAEEFAIKAIRGNDRANWATAPILAMFATKRKEMLERYHAIIDIYERESALPLWKQDMTAADRAIDELMDSPCQYELLRIWISSTGRYIHDNELATQRLDALRTLCALVRFEREQGLLPNELKQLIPRYLDSLPIDRFDGQVLRYRIRDGQPVLYSVGTNQQDDGGISPTKEDDAHRVEYWPPDIKVLGDWILFPPRRVGYPRAPEPEDDAEALTDDEGEGIPQHTNEFDAAEEPAVR